MACNGLLQAHLSRQTMASTLALPCGRVILAFLGAEDVGLNDKQAPGRLSPVSEAGTPLCSLPVYHRTPTQPKGGLAPS